MDNIGKIAPVCGAALILCAQLEPVEGMSKRLTLSPRDVAAVAEAVAVDEGIDAKAFAKEAEIESHFHQFAHNKQSGAAGPFQFIASTARRYGLKDPYDVYASARAAAKLWKDNRDYLRKTLGKEPTAGMVYLAHQEGAWGAAQLLAHPERKARDIVGRRAVILNGGATAPDMTAGEFARKWTSKFD